MWKSPRKDLPSVGVHVQPPQHSTSRHTCNTCITGGGDPTLLILPKAADMLQLQPFSVRQARHARAGQYEQEIMRTSMLEVQLSESQ